MLSTHTQLRPGKLNAVFGPKVHGKFSDNLRPLIALLETYMK